MADSNSKDWKHQNNKVSSLTTAQLIENTILESCWCEFHKKIEETKENYYKAIAILNEIL